MGDGDRTDRVGGESVVTDPAAEAARRAWEEFTRFPRFEPISTLVATTLMDATARETLKPIREAMAEIGDRYNAIERLMLQADSAAESSRHMNEMIGLKFAHDLLAPLTHTTEELEK